LVSPDKLFEAAESDYDAKHGLIVSTYAALDLVPLLGTAKQVLEFGTTAEQIGLGEATKRHGLALGLSFARDIAVGVSVLSRLPTQTAVPQSDNAALIQDIARRAEAKIGGTGRLAGSEKHLYAERLLERYQGIFGDRGLSTEVRYIYRRPWQPGDGLLDSVKLDVVEGNLVRPTRVFDYKFGNQGLTPARLNEIRRASGFGNDVPIIEVKP